MPPRLPAPIMQIGLNIFRRLPPSIRRRAIHAGTPNFTVGAVLLLRDDDGRVLLVRQRHTRGWSLPGGLLGHGESPREAVVREVYEELGLHLDPDDVAEAVPHALVNPQSRRVDVVFTLTRSADVDADGVEILEATWFAPTDLPRCTRGTYLVLTRCGVVTPPIVTAPAGIVLAAGAGIRLRPLTERRPKALCPIANVPLVDRALASLHRAGIGDIAVNAHHLAEQVADHVDGRAHLSIESPVALGTAGAVGALRAWLDGRDALICNSDAYLVGDLDILIKGWTGEHPRLLVIRDPERADFGAWRFAGASLLPWSYAKDLPAQPAGLYEAVWQAAHARGQLEFVEHAGTFIDCGTPRDYLAANLHASGGVSVVGDGAIVAGELVRSVVWPGAVVERGERLVDCVRTDTGLTVDCSG